MAHDDEFSGVPVPAALLLAHPPAFAIFDRNGVPLDARRNLDPRIDPMVLVQPAALGELMRWGEAHLAALLADETIPLWERQYFLFHGLVLQAQRLYRYRARFARVPALLEILQLGSEFLARERSTYVAALSMMPPVYRPETHAAGTALLATALLVEWSPPDSLPAAVLAAPLMAGLGADVGLVDSHRDLLSFERPMTPPERNILRAHPHSSSQLARRIGMTSEHILQAIEYHHERIDGSGYPLGLGGDAVPRLAQCVGLADTYLTLTAERPRNEALSAAAAISAVSTSAYSPELVELLWNLVRGLPEQEASFAERTGTAVERT
jgi:HD domain